MDSKSTFYRGSGIGRALLASLQEMLQEQEMNQDQALFAMNSFDKTTKDELSMKPFNGVTLQGQVFAYQCNGSRVWTLLVKNAVLSSPQGVIETPYLKILACEATS